MNKNIVKRILDNVLWIIVASVIAFCAGRDLAICKSAEDQSYTRDAIVISRTHDAIYVEDVTGNYWGFGLDYDYQIGDYVQMKMSDNGTIDDIEDDEIIAVRQIK